MADMEKLGGYLVHPLASKFPLLEGERFEKFKEDIRVNGQRVPVMLDVTGKILLDGRNRLRALIALGIKDAPRVDRLDENKDQAAYIWSMNMERRDLTDEQRLQRYTEWKVDVEQAKAALRQRSGLKKGTEPAVGTNVAERGRAAEKIAKETNMSIHKTKMAVKIHKEAPDLAEKVSAGEMKLKDAVKQIVTNEARLLARGATRVRRLHNADDAKPKQLEIPKPFDQEKALNKIYELTVRAIAAHWDLEDRSKVSALLQQIADDLKAQDETYRKEQQTAITEHEPQTLTAISTEQHA